MTSPPAPREATAYPMVTIGSDGQIDRSGPVFPQYRGCDCRLVPWRDLARLREDLSAAHQELGGGWEALRSVLGPKPAPDPGENIGAFVRRVLTQHPRAPEGGEAGERMRERLLVGVRAVFEHLGDDEILADEPALRCLATVAWIAMHRAALSALGSEGGRAAAVARGEAGE